MQAAYAMAYRGQAGTSQEQLNEALKGHPGFLGAFAADELPDSINLRDGPKSLIVNYSRSDSPSGGSHWVAMIFPMYGDALYFDSFGKHPDNWDNRLATRTGFASYLARHSYTGRYAFNHMDLQCYGASDVCGEWCVEFIRIGALPRRGMNNNGWDRIIQGRRSVPRRDNEFAYARTTGCDRRDAAVFKAAGVRKKRAVGYLR